MSQLWQPITDPPSRTLYTQHAIHSGDKAFVVTYKQGRCYLKTFYTSYKYFTDKIVLSPQLLRFIIKNTKITFQHDHPHYRRNLFKNVVQD